MKQPHERYAGKDVVFLNPTAGTDMSLVTLAEAGLEGDYR
jgi:hypothetical protein